MKNNINGIHWQRYKEIRKCVNFTLSHKRKWSSYEKKKVLSYYKEISNLAARPHYIYRPRNKTRLHAAQSFSQHTGTLRGITVAFVPTDEDGKRPNIVFSKNNKKMTVKGKFVHESFLDFDKFLLLSDTDAHINDTVNRAPNATSFTVASGNFEINKSVEASLVPKTVKRLMAKYGDEGKNNYFGNWMTGLRAYEFGSQSGEREYFLRKENAKKERQRKKRNRYKNTKKQGKKFIEINKSKR